MPSGYNEIPGVYSESPRPLAGFRRTLRTYRWCLGATVCVLCVISIAAFISVLIGTGIDNINDERNEEETTAKGDTKNKTIDTLLSLPWPRRDEEWYKNRWYRSRMRCPFEGSASFNASCLKTPTRKVKRAAGDDDGDVDDDVLVDDQDLFETTQQSMFDDPQRNNDDSWFDNTEREVTRYEDSHDGSTYPPEDTFNWNREASHLPEFSALRIGEVMSRSSQMEKDKRNLEKHLFDNDIFLEKDSPAFYHQKAFRKTSSKAFEMARQGYRMDGASREICKMLNLNKEDSTFDSRWLGDLNQSPYCDYEYSKVQCSKSDIYRSIDGTCNNLENPHWGSAYTSFRRAMPPDYADGVLSPRIAKNGGMLPSARLISLKVHINKRVSSDSYTHLTMGWGQFIDHDITATAQSKGINGTGLVCCEDEVSGNASLYHPECFSISIPEEDEFFSSKNKSCMEFSRSASSPRCTFGPREQLNQNTHFLDGSVIYGSSLEELNELRTHKEGLMRTQVTIDGRQLLKPSLNPNDSCNTEQQMYWKQHCFVSGDSRVNEHILLTIMHTVWTRQHNYIAGELRDINPNWDDERLFQESRRIIIAQIQHITYHEFLPSILGPHLSYGLKLSPTFSGKHWKGYMPKIHPGIANGFAAGAFRFGHSMIQGLMQSVDSTGANVKFEQIRKYFFSPFSIYDPDTIPDMVRGQVSQKASAVDTYFTSQVTNRLFQTPKTDYGLDLVAINIQRGRDHGIPSYTRWRMMCGLPLVKNFTDLQPDMDTGALQSIEQIYDDVDDIDLYTGGLAELPIKDGLVGPTFACIIADQFLRLKMGDRFWYEQSSGPNPFTKDQLFELHKTTLARILCNNINELGSIQRWALRKFETDNPRLACSARSIPRMSLGPWEEGEI